MYPKKMKSNRCMGTSITCVVQLRGIYYNYGAKTFHSTIFHFQSTLTLQQNMHNMRIPLNSPQCSSFALSKLEYVSTYVSTISCWNKFFRTGRLRSSMYVRTYVCTYIIHVRAELAVKVSALEYKFQSCPHDSARSPHFASCTKTELEMDRYIGQIPIRTLGSGTRYDGRVWYEFLSSILARTLSTQGRTTCTTTGILAACHDYVRTSYLQRATQYTVRYTCTCTYM